jgi:predicted ATPase
VSKFSKALITRVVVRGFRSLENVAVDLAPVTVLAGPNGSGKSSFVDALAFLQQALQDSPQEAFRSRDGIEEVLTRTGQLPDTVSVEVHIQSRAIGLFSGSYFVKFKERRKKLSIEQESCEMTIGPEQTIHRFTVERGEWKESPEGIEPRLAESRLALPLMASLEYFVPMYNALTSMYFYSITPEALKAWQASERGDQLTLNGSNASSVLKRLSETDQTDYRRVVQAISQIVPSIQGITFKKRGRELRLAFSESFTGHKELSFEASSMSDGILRILGILLAVYQEETPTIVGFEEPETAVHPGAAAALAEIFQEAGLRVQILVTTHSPDLITRFDVKSLRAVDRTDGGVTIIAPIAESQREAILRRLFTAGEIHRIEGLRPSVTTSEEPSEDA